MTKNFCDICGKEIIGNSLYGGIMRHKKVYTLERAMKVGENTMNAAPVVPEAIDLCEECQKKVWEFVGTLKEVK